MIDFWSRHKALRLFIPVVIGFICVVITVASGGSGQLAAAPGPPEAPSLEYIATAPHQVTRVPSVERDESMALLSAATPQSVRAPASQAPSTISPVSSRQSAASIAPYPANSVALDMLQASAQLAAVQDVSALPPMLQAGMSTMSNPPMPDTADFVVDTDSDRVWGVVTPGATITVTVDGVQMGAALADNVGFFWTLLYDAGGSRHALMSGDTIAIYENGAQQSATTLRAITGQIDVVADVVSGNVDGWASSTITLYPTFDTPDLAMLSWNTTTSPSGDFSLDLSADWNLIADERVVVAYVENDIAVYGKLYAQRLIVQPFPWGNLLGYATPGAQVTGTIVMSDGISIRDFVTGTADPETGLYFFPVNMRTNDTAYLEVAGGATYSRTVDALWLKISASQDQLSAFSTPGATVVAKILNLTPLGWQRVTTETIADASGYYTFAMAGSVDILPGHFHGVYVADADGDDLNLWAAAQGSVIVNQGAETVSGIAVAPPAFLADGGTVTLTHYSAIDDATYTYTTTRQNWGFYNFYPDDPLPSDIDFATGDVVTVTSEGYGWAGVVEIQDVTAAPDTVNDRIVGAVNPPTAQVEVQGTKWDGWSPEPAYPVAGSFVVSVTANSPFTATPPGFDIRNAMQYYVRHLKPGETQEEVSGVTDFVRAWPGFNMVGMQLSPPGVPFTMTLKDGGGAVKGVIADSFNPPPGELLWVNFGMVNAQMMPGDSLHVVSDEGFDQTIAFPWIEVRIDGAPDHVVGVAAPNQLIHILMEDDDQGWVPTGPDGSFNFRVADLQFRNGDGQFSWGEQVRICIETLEGNHVCHWFLPWPDIIAHYAMDGYNDVWGNSSLPGNPILITVTDELHNIVITGTTFPGSGDQGGLSYHLELPNATIMPGYKVTANFGDGIVEFVDVVGITAYPGIVSNVVTGTAPADSFIHLNVDCYYGGCWNALDDVPVDATGVYTADFNTVGHDIQYGDSFNIHHGNDRGHQTQYSFWIPLPELQIEKQGTPGIARPGGSYLYQIRYWNNGNGDAENVLITDTLPAHTAYGSDTSGFPVVDGGTVVTWMLSTVPPYSYNEFYVALLVSGSAPTQTHLGDNCVLIGTTSPGDPDPGNNGSCAGGPWVDDSDIDLWVNKGVDPGDPTPGEEFHYYIEYGTNTPAATGPVWLTDTLPVSTTFVRWEEHHGWGALWTEVITTGGQVVLYAPAGLPGDMGGRVRLTLQLDPDAPLGMRLENHVQIRTGDDNDPNNDEYLNTDAQVSGPRYDLQVYKGLNGGDLTPGGRIDYWLQVENRGNSAVHVWVTDTLPSGLSYVPGSAGYGYWGGWIPIDPVLVSGNQIIWDLGMMGVSDGMGFGFQADIDESVGPDPDPIENCVTVASPYPDYTPANNTACVETTLYPNGPNLRVSKQVDWHGDGQLGYQIQLQNIGDEILPNILLTDTYPVSTTFHWEWGEDGWLPFQLDMTDNYTDSQLIWLFEYLEPGWTWNAWFNVDLINPGEQMRWYTNTLETTTPDGDPSPGDNAATVVAFSGGEVDRVEVWVHPIGNGNMWGYALPGWVTVTTPYTTAHVLAGGDGYWQLDNAGPIGAGDPIEVAAGAGVMPVSFALPDPFDAEVDSAADIISGQIGGWFNQLIEVHGGWPAGYQEVTTGGDGSFVAPYGDIPRGAGGYIRFITAVNYAEVILHREFLSPDLLITADYSNDGVDGNFAPGHTGWVTVTDSTGILIKATIEITTEMWPWWNGDSGFSTHHNEHDWFPERPDIMPFDWISVTMDNGASTGVRVGIIDAGVDVTTNVVSGTLDVDWFSDPLRVSCEIHENNGPNNIESYVDPDGGAFRCDFTGVWDIVPGDNVAVNYTEPDGDRVQNRPDNPAPSVRIQKWLDGGEPGVGVGGNAIFTVQYRNEGGLPAEDVVITDTLQGMTYITDTSGFSVTGSGSGPIVWYLGTVNPGDWIGFDVFAGILVGEGARVTNTIEITTSNPFNRSNWDERHAMWSGEVANNQTDLNVGKNAWTGDPAPGRDVVFEVNICNNGGTASSKIVLTDTTPLSLTLQGWWGGSAGWIEHSLTTHQLVASRPAIAAWTCETVYVYAEVDAGAWPGMPISNTATITAANDLTNYDNLAIWWGNVNSEHTNLDIHKDWSDGVLVPGGRLAYWIHFNNSGNVPVGAFSITDTLPVSTTFRAAEYYDRIGEPLTTPPTLTVHTDSVVWEFSGLENGFGGHIYLVLDVDGNAKPGAILENRATISQLPGEDTYDDNKSVWTEVLLDEGPNLRIRKSGQWDDWGPDTRRASYWLSVENVGTAPMWDVAVTDYFPTGMYMDGGLGINYWDWADWRDNGDHFTATLRLLEPGQSVGMNFGLITDTSPLPFGLIFTNTVEVMPVPGEVNFDDNHAQVVLTTGPDLYVKKNLVSGSLLPGELVTYSLTFGNDRWGNEWWWSTQGSVWVTDTLPGGFTFITATRRSYGWGPYPPDVVDGDHLAWDTGFMPSGGEDEILLTVRVPVSATGLDTFINVATVASSEPVSDTEPYLDNNTSEVAFAVPLPYFEVDKIYDSTRVAGTLVTYTLTVENHGHVTGTNVVLSDTVPGLLSYVDSDGAPVGSSVIWTFASIVPDDSASGWFNAELPCATGDVTNEDYRVMSSDEGPTSENGDPVVLTVIAPSLSVIAEASGPVVVGETVYFTAAGATNGTPFTYESWDFGAGPAVGGATASHVFTIDGTHPVTVTVRDDCGYVAQDTVWVTVDPPDLIADFGTVPAPPNIIKGQSVEFIDASTTNGPAIAAWSWDFGDGAGSSGNHPFHHYDTVGAFDVTLTVTDTLGYSDTVVKPALVVVAPDCTPITSVSIAYMPLRPFVHDAVTFTATALPAAATAPLTYTWTFGDGNGGTVTTSAIQHTYTVSGTMTALVKVYNPCTPAGISQQTAITIYPYKVYLPAVMRAKP